MWSKMSIGLYVNYLLYLSDFNETWNFCASFLKILKYQISGKSVLWEPSCFMMVDGRTDRQVDKQTDRQREITKLIVAFLNFVNSPKSWKTILRLHKFRKWHVYCTEKFKIHFNSTCNLFIRDKNIFSFFFFTTNLYVYFLISFYPFLPEGLSPYSWYLLFFLSTIFLSNEHSSMSKAVNAWAKVSVLTPAITPHPLQFLFLPLYVPRIIKANE
jgi:hypothetical protein